MTNAEKLSVWRQRNPEALAELGDFCRRLRGIAPDPQSPITTTLLAQDVESALAIIFKIREETP